MLAVGRDRELLGEVERLIGPGWDLVRSEGEVGAAELLQMRLDAVVVDVGGLEDGFDYVEAVCGDAPAVGLLVCSGRVSRERRVRALREGVDDWITKPMDALEVVARIEAVTCSRRSDEVVGRQRMAFGALVIEPEYVQARLDGENLALTRRELDLLTVLAESRGRVVERDELYRRAWGYAMPPGDRSVDVFVAKLRMKLEEKAGRRYIHTHFGIGYRFDAETPEVGSGEGPETARLPPALSSVSIC